MRNVVKLTKGITTVQTLLSSVNIVIVLLLIAGGGEGERGSMFWIYVLGYHSKKKEKGKETLAPSWQLYVTSEVRGGVNFSGLTSYQTSDPFLTYNTKTTYISSNISSNSVESSGHSSWSVVKKKKKRCLHFCVSLNHKLSSSFFFLLFYTRNNFCYFNCCHCGISIKVCTSFFEETAVIKAINHLKRI